jgi:5'-AMP-activated protein kinase regulatory gamma subunit
MWNSERSRFAGMFTVNDIIHLIQWYYNTAETFDNATEDLESLKLESLRRMPSLHPSARGNSPGPVEIERDLGVAPPPLLSEHPSATLYDTAKRLVETHARRLPLLDIDTDTGHEAIVSVLTTYRLLHFISVNVSAIDVFL